MDLDRREYFLLFSKYSSGRTVNKLYCLATKIGVDFHSGVFSRLAKLDEKKERAKFDVGTIS